MIATAQTPTSGPPWYRMLTWRALGTEVVLVVAGSPSAEPELMIRAEAIARGVLDRIDATCSRFRQDSDLSRANQQAGDWVQVDPMLIEAVEAALWAADRSNGMVDPTLGLDLCAHGYDTDLDDVRARASYPTSRHPGALPVPPPLRGGWRRLELDSADCRIRVPFGCALDLGATGKAFAADTIAQTLADALGQGCLVSLGGDIAIGIASDGEHPWQIAVTECPTDPVADQICLPRGAIATSTTLRRTWEHGGRRKHHVIDPRTGEPSRGVWRTATVIAPTCLEANTATTTALVLGEAAPQWLSNAGLAARLVAVDGTQRLIGDWPASALDRPQLVGVS